MPSVEARDKSRRRVHGESELSGNQSSVALEFFWIHRTFSSLTATDRNPSWTRYAAVDSRAGGSPSRLLVV